MYTRHTELRKLDERDEYNLALKLNEDDVWRLMEIIPHRINAQQCSDNGTLDWQQAINKDGRKFRHLHFELMKNAFRASGGTRLISQILLDEWKTSGRKEERPTLGVLLQLLVGANCWMAADFLATEILHEPKPRPLEGPAALFLPPVSEISDTTNVNGLSTMNNNQDNGTKFMVEKEVLIPKTNERDKETNDEMVNGLGHMHTVPPVAPNANSNNTQTTNTQNNTPMTLSTNAESEGTLDSSRNIPPISKLITMENSSVTNSSNMLSKAPVPNISVLWSNEEAKEETNETENAIKMPNEVLHHMRELSIDCEQAEVPTGGGSTSSSNSSMSNEGMNNENDLEYIPNLSLLEQNSSNNDSSLTNVTGTSGENSFETSPVQDEQEIALKTNSSLEAADDNESVTISQDNIPCLSALKQ